MTKKLAAWTTLLAFLLFDLACVIHTTKREPPEKVYGGQTQILSVLKKSGEYIEFPKETPGRVMGDRIVGSERYLEIPNSDIKRIISKDGQPSEIEKVDGTKIPIAAVWKTDEWKTVVRLDSSPLSIPLADVAMVTIRKSGPGPDVPGDDRRRGAC